LKKNRSFIKSNPETEDDETKRRSWKLRNSPEDTRSLTNSADSSPRSVMTSSAESSPKTPSNETPTTRRWADQSAKSKITNTKIYKPRYEQSKQYEKKTKTEEDEIKEREELIIKLSDAWHSSLEKIEKPSKLFDAFEKTSGLTNEDHLAKLICELYKTEETYVHSLEQLLSLYILKLSNEDMPESKVITGDLIAIYNVSLKLYEKMRDVLTTNDDVNKIKIGELFLSFKEELKCYSTYSVNYEKALKIPLAVRDNEDYATIVKNGNKEKFKKLRNSRLFDYANSKNASLCYAFATNPKKIWIGTC